MKKSGNSRILFFALFVLFTLVINSCKKEGSVAELTTISCSLVTHNSVSCGGNVTMDGGSEITVRGVCWSTNAEPDINDNKTTDGTGTGLFTSVVNGLTPSITYYIRAYATNSAGTAYGNVVSFTTLVAPETASDIDGNVYHVVTIGTQKWMLENLKTTKYRNGDPITLVSDNDQWDNLTTSAYCNYNNDDNYPNTYGRLYNWYAVNDIRNIAPEGWHIPTDAEWYTLVNAVGAPAGDHLKESGTAHWGGGNAYANNHSGFTALPGGLRYEYGSFSFINLTGFWWTKTASTSTKAWDWTLYYDESGIFREAWDKRAGFSVRCVKD